MASASSVVAALDAHRESADATECGLQFLAALCDVEDNKVCVD
jgi:hypothetical protein